MIEDCPLFKTTYDAPTQCKYTPPRQLAVENCAGPREGLCGPANAALGDAPKIASLENTKQHAAAPAAPAPAAPAPSPAVPVVSTKPSPKVKIVYEEVVIEETVTQYVKRAAASGVPRVHPYDHDHVRHIPRRQMYHQHGVGLGHRHGHHRF